MSSAVTLPAAWVPVLREALTDAMRDARGLDRAWPYRQVVERIGWVGQRDTPIEPEHRAAVEAALRARVRAQDPATGTPARKRIVAAEGLLRILDFPGLPTTPRGGADR
jgi:hypothetical protein